MYAGLTTINLRLYAETLIDVVDTQNASVNTRLDLYLFNFVAVAVG